MQFEEYNGWPNFPTWDVFTAMTSYYETYQELERIADRSTTPNEIKRYSGPLCIFSPVAGAIFTISPPNRTGTPNRVYQKICGNAVSHVENRPPFPDKANSRFGHISQDNMAPHSGFSLLHSPGYC
jgi:hypothetical protein